MKSGFYRHCTGLLVLAFLLVGCGAARRSASHTSDASLSSATFKTLGIPAYASGNPALLATIAEWMGTPYQYGGNSKKGVDCSGFIGAVYAKVYEVKLPRSSAEIAEIATSIKEKNLLEGDLVFFRINTKKTGHAGIYLTDGYFAHASTSRGVMISRLSDDYWKKFFTGAGSVLSPEQRRHTNP